MRISGLFDPMALVGAALGSGGSPAPSGGSAPGAPGSTTTVSPTIQTAISPQISPNFIQTGAGSTGSVSAGTSMTAGTTQSAATPRPTTGAPPYADIGMPYPGSPPNIAPFPNLVQTGSGLMQYMPYALGALGLVALVSMAKGKRAAPRTTAQRRYLRAVR